MTSLDEVQAALVAAHGGGEVRAGGTDLQDRLGDRRRRGLPVPPVVDVGGVDALCGLGLGDDGELVVGAATTIAVLAESALVVGGWPALAAAAAGLATPQIRSQATAGGNLLQATRCPYVRNLHVDCWRTGGSGCPARDGVHDRGVVVDLGPCAQPHPSTLAAALLAHEAVAVVHGADGDEEWTLTAVLGDGTDAARAHQLDGDELLVSLRVPRGWDDERGAYVRAAGRRLAEWPLVEVVVRAQVGDVCEKVVVTAGGVATVPLRFTEVEQALTGIEPTPALIASAAARVAERCSPLPQTGYKRALLVGTVQTALERALLPSMS